MLRDFVFGLLNSKLWHYSLPVKEEISKNGMQIHTGVLAVETRYKETHLNILKNLINGEKSSLNISKNFNSENLPNFLTKFKISTYFERYEYKLYAFVDAKIRSKKFEVLTIMVYHVELRFIAYTIIQLSLSLQVPVNYI